MGRRRGRGIENGFVKKGRRCEERMKRKDGGKDWQIGLGEEIRERSEEGIGRRFCGSRCGV